MKCLLADHVEHFAFIVTAEVQVVKVSRRGSVCCFCAIASLSVNRC